MSEAARYEERARQLERAMAEEEARAAAEQAAQAERLARAAAEARRMEQEKLAAERAAADQARIALQQEREAERMREAAAAIAARAAADAAARQAAAERALEAARRSLADAQSARAVAERDAKANRSGLHDYDRRLKVRSEGSEGGGCSCVPSLCARERFHGIAQAIADEVQRHEANAAAAKDALKRAEADERSAQADVATSQSLASKLQNWWSTAPHEGTVTAVAQVSGCRPNAGGGGGTGECALAHNLLDLTRPHRRLAAHLAHPCMIPGVPRVRTRGCAWTPWARPRLRWWRRIPPRTAGAPTRQWIQLPRRRPTAALPRRRPV